MPVIGWVVVLALVGWFALRVWVPRLTARDRRSLVSDGVSAVIALMLGRALVPMPGLLSWVWVAVAAVTAAAVATVVLRWPDLPWAVARAKDGSVRSGRRGPALVSIGAYAALGVLAVVVLI